MLLWTFCREQRFQHYLGTTGLYGTAYAASLGSEKYSSDFGWSAAPSYSSKKYELLERNHHIYKR